MIFSQKTIDCVTGQLVPMFLVTCMGPLIFKLFPSGVPAKNTCDFYSGLLHLCPQPDKYVQCKEELLSLFPWFLKFGDNLVNAFTTQAIYYGLFACMVFVIYFVNFGHRLECWYRKRKSSKPSVGSGMKLIFFFSSTLTGEADYLIETAYPTTYGFEIFFLPLLLFCIALFWFFFGSAQVIYPLMALELMLFSVSLFFLVTAVTRGSTLGLTAPLLLLAVAATESVIGLGLIILMHRLKQTVHLGAWRHLHGAFIYYNAQNYKHLIHVDPDMLPGKNVLKIPVWSETWNFTLHTSVFGDIPVEFTLIFSLGYVS